MQLFSPMQIVDFPCGGSSKFIVISLTLSINIDESLIKHCFAVI